MCLGYHGCPFNTGPVSVDIISTIVTLLFVYAIGVLPVNSEEMQVCTDMQHFKVVACLHSQRKSADFVRICWDYIFFFSYVV